MAEARLPAHLEVSGLLRQVEAAGGFATVLRRGERDAGTLLVVLTEKGYNSRLYERMPQLDGTRRWHCAARQDPDDPQAFDAYLLRRGTQDSDIWIIELDVAHPERFIGLSTDD